MRKKMLFFVLCLIVGIGLATAQNSRKITGVVISSEDNQPIVGASVVPTGYKTGAITDVNGAFTLSISNNVKTITISYIGMQSKTVQIRSGRINVTLDPVSKELNEVIVVAYGTAKKSAFTGSAAVVSSEDISKHITTNVADALVGSVAGLQMRGSSGQPGSGGGSINIRGIASMYAGTDPLIIVDGAPYPASLSNIPPGDIESVSVLKDAASAALYGARGAAGVIIVTTKKGKTQEAIINVDMKWGSNSRAVQDYDVIKDPGAYYEAYYNEVNNYYYYGQGYSAANANVAANKKMLSDLAYNVYTVPDGEQLIGTDGKLNSNATLGRKYTLNGTQYYMQPDNWTDMAYKNTLRQEYNVSINGGSDRASYYTSIGYLKDDGIIEYSGYDRISARIRADYQAKKWLKVGANVGYVHSKQKATSNMGTSLNSTNLMYFTTMMAPIYPVFVRVVDAEGNIVIKTDANGHEAYDYGVASSGYGVTRPFSSTGNPLGTNRYNSVYSKGDQLNGTFTADVNITDFLKFNATSTVIWGLSNYSDYQNPFEGPKVGVNGQLTKSDTNTLRTNNVQTLTFLKNFGKHSVNVMLGHEYYRTTSKYLAAVATGGFSPDIQEIDAFAKKTDSSSYTSKYNVEGFFGSAQYNYDDRYFFSASYRRDASSRFAKEHRWGNFWSVGGAWLLSKESFMSDLKWIDLLKVKASVGQQGNDNIGNYAYTDIYTLAKSSDTVMSPTFSRMGNSNITWETTTNFNFGLEFSLFKGRLSGNVDVYTKKTTDLLFWLSIPESAGSRGYYGNIGDMRNTGVEVSFTGAIVRTKDLDWTVSANFSHNKTKILKLPESKTADNGGFSESNSPRTYQNWFREGGELYNAFMPKYAGLNEKGEATYWVDENLEGATNKPGTNYSSTTTNPNKASKYELGSVLPKVFGGFSTSISYKGFDASMTFDFQIGGKIYDIRYASLMSPTESASGAGQSIHKDYAKAWTPNNTSSNIPRWQYGDQYATATSDRFLTNASYLNFQSFTLGYTFPKNLIPYISKLRIYVAGENLGFISARKGLDPRYSYDGNTSVATYSPVRNISGGIQLTF
jgi:TonB-linked SusC/RagA family outer membrane protein